MNKIILTLVVLLTTTGVHSNAFSQIPGFGRSTSDSSGASTDLLEAFSISSRHNLDAQLHFATALGLFDVVQLLQEEQSSFSSDQIDQGSTEKAISVSIGAQEAITARIAEQPELTAEDKERYSLGLISYFLAIETAREVVVATQSTPASTFRNPFAAARAVITPSFVAAQAPKYLKDLQNNASHLIDFGLQNEIDPPIDATAFLEDDGSNFLSFSQISDVIGAGVEGVLSSTDLLTSFNISSAHNVQAQLHFAYSLGLQDQVQLLQAEQNAISSGQIDQESTQKAISVSDTAQEAIAARLADQPELTAEGKERYTQGLISYFLAIATVKDVVIAAQQTAQNASSALSNPLAAARGAQSARSSLFVVRQAPDYLKNLQNNASMLIAFGRSNGLEPPSNATSLLDSLD